MVIIIARLAPFCVTSCGCHWCQNAPVGHPWRHFIWRASYFQANVFGCFHPHSTTLTLDIMSNSSVSARVVLTTIAIIAGAASFAWHATSRRATHIVRPSPMIKGVGAPTPFNSTTSLDTTDWPPLNSLISDEANGIIGDVQFLLDFAIVASPKTGTTEQMHYLANHPEIQMYKHELHILTHHTPAMLVKTLYDLPPGRQYKRGYKSPHEFERKFFTRYYRQYWPNTKLIIGVRHPVKWFESHYNFVTRMGNQLPPAESFVGANFKHTVKYHEHLAKLGMTNMSDPNEYILLNQTSAPSRWKSTTHDESNLFIRRFPIL